MPKIKDEKSLKIRPLMGYILIQPDVAETKTVGGLYLPESAQEKPAQGTVLAIGENLYLPNGGVFNSPVQVGDKVLYKKWGGDEIKYQGFEYKLVKFEDLIAIID